MAVAKVVALLLLFSLVLTTGVFSDEEPTTTPGSASEIQLEQLHAKIHTLESQVEEKRREVKEREETVTEKEKLLKERQDKVSSLETELSSLREKGSSESVQLLEKAQARATELEKQVEVLKNFLEQKNKEKESTEARTSEAEKKLNELNSRLDKLHKTKEEQKNKIRKLERALKISEEEMLRMRHEAATKARELQEVHGSWLPHWLAVHWVHFQTVAGPHWDAHGKPVLEKVTQKVTQAKTQAERWAEPHMVNVKTVSNLQAMYLMTPMRALMIMLMKSYMQKYIPAVKETVKTHVEPHVQTLSTKAKEAYHASKSAVTPHIVKFQAHVDPYYQEAKKFSKPYVDQVATATKPHADKAIHYYKEFLKSATTYHDQVQANVERKLKSHELTAPFATKEFIWFAVCICFVGVTHLHSVQIPLFSLPATQRPRSLRDTRINMVVVRPKGLILTSEICCFPL
ncbi:hypothetical protein HID58_036060 [Brassica napus]|uniref:Uncharacterized protein n=1 Tax=Brassica napus TaxID=3708 RepID=A0ABQ8C6N1_BRANA|nr:hypothetical protein HID58_036060 [Brassica napus]